MNMNYKIITGANDDYILTLIDFIYSYIRRELDLNNLIIYDLGISKENREKIPSTIHLKLFDYSLYPEYVNLNKYNGLHCSYAFKPIIIYNEVQLNPDIPVIWMDSANRFNKPIIQKIVEVLFNQGIYSPISQPENTIETIELNHPITCRKLGITEQEQQKYLTSRSGNIVGVLYSSIAGKQIIDEWYTYALDKDIIIPVGSSRNNHRQDQTVLSILMYLYEKKTNIKFERSKFDILQWCKRDPPKVEEDYFPFILIEKKTRTRKATIYTKTLVEAIQVYMDRKNMVAVNFLNDFYVCPLSEITK